MSPRDAQLETKTLDFASLEQVTIDRPAKDVWPWFFGEKLERLTNFKYAAIAGEQGKVGEVYALALPESSVYAVTRFFYEAIKIEPEQWLVLKISYEEMGGSDRQLAGYDLITLNEAAGRTTVVLQQAFECPVKTALHRATAEQGNFLTDLWQKLKRLVESSQ